MDSNVKLSNVIGAPFSDYVLLQLYIRAARNSTTNRTNEEVLFLANKTAWARLVSSVNIHFPASETNKVTQADYQAYYSQFNLNSGLPYNAPDSLAKNWILEAGTSIQDGNGIALRSGIGPDGAYGLGGTEELGYRPMPGLTGVTVEAMQQTLVELFDGKFSELMDKKLVILRDNAKFVRSSSNNN